MAFLRRRLIGHPLATEQAVHERLTKTVALSVFSPDAPSSSVHATEEILLVLAVAATAPASGLRFFALPLSLVIAVLLWIVGISYRQTSCAYTIGQDGLWSRAITGRSRREQYMFFLQEPFHRCLPARTRTVDIRPWANVFACTMSSYAHVSRVHGLYVKS
jgi:hypothetical protein